MNIQIGKTVSSLTVTASIQIDALQLWEYLREKNPDLPKEPPGLSFDNIQKQMFLGSARYADTVTLSWNA